MLGAGPRVRFFGVATSRLRVDDGEVHGLEEDGVVDVCVDGKNQIDPELDAVDGGVARVLGAARCNPIPISAKLCFLSVAGLDTDKVAVLHLSLQQLSPWERDWGLAVVVHPWAQGLSVVRNKTEADLLVFLGLLLGVRNLGV